MLLLLEASAPGWPAAVPSHLSLGMLSRGPQRCTTAASSSRAVRSPKCMRGLLTLHSQPAALQPRRKREYRQSRAKRRRRGESSLMARGGRGQRVLLQRAGLGWPLRCCLRRLEAERGMGAS